MRALTLKVLIETRQIRKKLDKCINRAVSSLNALPTREEIVFLPYKAAMWDSLETVWRKVDREADVTTIVMPVPYFDKNSDGSLREMHYEGDMFPAEVPVTDYKSYSLEEKHPEAIYIHNPYDGMNYVTGIHPDFYSSRIKNFTDELVYIPYFVLDEVSPDNKSACEGIKHFVTVPGVIYDVSFDLNIDINNEKQLPDFAAQAQADADAEADAAAAADDTAAAE